MLLDASGGFWRLLEASGGSWRLSGTFWMLLKQAGSWLEAGWREAGGRLGRLEAGWRQVGGRWEAGWRQAGGRLEAGWRLAGLTELAWAAEASESFWRLLEASGKPG